MQEMCELVLAAFSRGRVARWMMELAEYDFRIEFVPGRLNDVADALSRLMAEGPNDKENSIEFRDYLRDLEVSYESIETMFASDEFAVD